MKIGHPPNYFVQVFREPDEADAVTLVLNVTVSVTFVPDPTADEIHETAISVTPNPARAGELEILPVGDAESLIFSVSPDEFTTYAAELEQLSEIASSSLPSVRRDDVLDRAVIRFVDEHVLEHPEVRKRRGTAVHRPPATPAGPALEDFVAAPTWADAITIAADRLRDTDGAFQLSTHAVRLARQGDARAAGMRRYADVLTTVRRHGVEAALQLAESRIDPEETKDRDRWVDLISGLPDVPPAELVTLAHQNPWLLSQESDAVLWTMTLRATESTDLTSALGFEYRRLLLRSIGTDGPAATLAVVNPVDDPEVRLALLRHSQGADLLPLLALHDEVSGVEARATLNNIATLLVLRFEEGAERGDLALAVLAYRVLLQVLADDDPPQLVVSAVSNTADALTAWEELTGETTHRSLAMVLHRQLLRSTPPGDVDRAAQAITLSGMLLAQAREPGSAPDLIDEAEAAIHAALPVLAGTNDPSRRVGLVHLAAAGLLRFERTGVPEPARAALAPAVAAIVDLPPDDPEHVRLADLLGRILAGTLVVARDPVLEEAAATLRRTPLDRMRAAQARYETTGSPTDLSHALDAARRAAELAAPRSDAEIVARTGLGVALRARFAAGGDVADLDEAVAELRRAIVAQRGTKFRYRATFHNLGAALLDRYRQRRDVADLDEAIGAFRRVVADTRSGDAERLGRVAGLADARRQRYLLNHDPEDLDAAIDLVRDELATSAPDHPHRPIALSTLALCLRHRFVDAGTQADLHEAAVLLRNALAQTPATAPTLRPLLGNYLLVLTGPAIRNARLRGRNIEPVERWTTDALDQAVRDCRAGGVVVSVVDGFTLPPEFEGR